MRRRFNAMLSLGLAGLASAMATVPVTADWTVDYVPDFDQIRGTLPNNGSMYCVPTAAMNWMSFLGNHGYPELGPSQSWQSQDAFLLISNRLASLGMLMNTDALQGTTGDNGFNGLVAWLAANAPDKVTVTQRFASGSGADASPLGKTIHSQGLQGSLVMMIYGRYNQTGPSTFTRSSGHAVSVSGIQAFPSIAQRVNWRDPASTNGNLFNQSQFSTNSSRFQDVWGTFDGQFRQQSQLIDLTGGSLVRFIDGYYAIRPLFGLTTCCDDLGVLMDIPVPPIGDPIVIDQIDSPSGTPIVDLDLMPDLLEAVLLCEPDAFGTPATVWKVDLSTGDETYVTDCPKASRFAVDRFGTIFVSNPFDDIIIGFAPDGTQQDYAMPNAVDDLVYDDDRDEVVGLSREGSSLITLKLSGSAPPLIQEHPLPAALALGAGNLNLAVDHTRGQYWIGDDESGTMHTIELDVAGVSPVQIGMLLPAIQKVREAAVMESGILLINSPDGVKAFDQAVDGSWVEAPDAAFAGLDAGGSIAILIVPSPRTRWSASRICWRC